MMNRTAVYLFATVGAFTATSSAFNAICTRQSDYDPRRYPPTSTGMMARTCAVAEEAATECSDSYEAARGVMMSEHAWLAREAMQWSGLAAFAEPTDDGPLHYYVDGDATPVPWGPGFASIAPAAPGLMTSDLRGKRSNNTIPAFAEAPDVSYSLADYILGNEHCFAENVFASEGAKNRTSWRDRTTENEHCHHFEMRRASVNSTHFSPQNRSMYTRYHGLALATASQCKQLADVLGTTSHHVVSCEREALTMEAYASHFLADAWSTGHMWERWGSPLYGDTREKRLRAQMTALLSGIIHGWKSTVRKYPVASMLQDDQLCMSGFFLNDLRPEHQSEFLKSGSTAALEETYATAMVRWTYPSTPTTRVGPFFGGGDNYLFSCPDSSPNSYLDPSMFYRRQHRWAVSTSPDSSHHANWPMAIQYRRMVTCMAKGFEEIYRRGPETMGRVQREQVFDPLITKSSDADDRCWDMRVTNQSMKLAMRISSGGYGMLDFTDPSIITHLGWQLMSFIGRSTSNSDLDLSTTFHEGTKFRVAMTRIGLAISRLAKEDPDGTSAARLDHPDLEVFNGLNRNSYGVPILATDQVSYLERSDKAHWHKVLESEVECALDSDCAPTEYCTDRAVLRDAPEPVFAKQCVRQEVAILRAFRDGEVAHFCGADTPADLSAARTACRQSTGGDSVACQACVQVIGPHVRLSGVPSLCDRLYVAGLVNSFEDTSALVSDLTAVDLDSATAALCETR